MNMRPAFLGETEQIMNVMLFFFFFSVLGLPYITVYFAPVYFCLGIAFFNNNPHMFHNMMFWNTNILYYRTKKYFLLKALIFIFLLLNLN